MQKSKCKDIALRIRRLIIAGELKPGEQLPTRTELERKFKVSKATMQKTIDSLVKDGTVYADGTNGTFVSEFPMEIYHYGLVFLHRPSHDRPWSRKWKTLLHEAENLFSKSPYRLSVFYGDRYHLNAKGNANFIYDIRAKRMAGLIFTMDPELFDGTDILQDPEIPIVSIRPKPGCKYASVDWDSTGCLSEMAKYLSLRKHSKTSLLMFSRQFATPGFIDHAVNELKSHGLETHRFLIHGIDISYPESVANIIGLMMNDTELRPDSIIILDDNLLPGVIEGLKSSNIRVPDDVELVAMVNFPYDKVLGAPVKMFGFDIPEQLKLVKQKLDAIRQKNKYEKTTVLKFISDTEYAKAGKAGKSDQ